jgi:hypothetical protein
MFNHKSSLLFSLLIVINILIYKSKQDNTFNSIDHRAIDDFNELLIYISPKQQSSILNINDADLFYFRLCLIIYSVFQLLCCCLLMILNNWHWILIHCSKNKGLNDESNQYSLKRTLSIVDFQMEQKKK